MSSMGRKVRGAFVNVTANWEQAKTKEGRYDAPSGNNIKPAQPVENAVKAPRRNARLAMRNNIKILEPDGSNYRDVTVDLEPLISFGAFRFLPSQRLLLEGDKQVRLGSRALDILIALIEKPGELVDKGVLMARVWPNRFVEPANLTVAARAWRRESRQSLSNKHSGPRLPFRCFRHLCPSKDRLCGTIASGEAQSTCVHDAAGWSR
jgi:hypothetical protein